MRSFVNSFSLKSSGILLLSVALGGSVAHAKPVVLGYSMTNPSDAQASTGLELTFNSKITLKGIGADGAKSKTFTSITTNVDEIDYGAPVNLAASDRDTGVCKVDDVKGGVQLTKALFHFQAGGDQPAKNPTPKLNVIIGKKDNGTIIFTNVDTATLFLSSVTASTDLPPSLFEDLSDSQLDLLIDNHLYATGAVPSFSLSPGQTVEFDLGPMSSLDNYTSTFFTVDYSASPAVDAIKLGFASNNEIPEPAAVMLLGAGAVLLSGRRRAARA